MGIRMLRRMGWRKGERLGEKRKKLLPKTYGCMLPPGGIPGVVGSHGFKLAAIVLILHYPWC